MDYTFMEIFFFVCALHKINKTKHMYVFMHLILDLFAGTFNLGNLEL
jgi:hypothetical protein